MRMTSEVFSPVRLATEAMRAFVLNGTQVLIRQGNFISAPNVANCRKNASVFFVRIYKLLPLRILFLKKSQNGARLAIWLVKKCP